MSRFEVRPLAADGIPAAAELLAERHRRHRVATPALDPAYDSPIAAEPLVEELLARDGASGALALADGRPVAYVIGAHRAQSWGANVWVDDAGCAGEPEAVRLAYAGLAERWVADGRDQHYVVVPATDEELIDAWFRLSFGVQHVHALQPVPGAGWQPGSLERLVVRIAQDRDVPAMVALDTILPRHVNAAPVFSSVAVPTAEESRAEIEEALGDPRFTLFVVEHAGRVVGTATACSIELSSGNTLLMRPPRCGFLGFAAVLPEARGLGAGRALGEAVLRWSRDEGYEWVAADWRSTNLEADRTWRAMGFRPSFYRLYRSIA